MLEIKGQLCSICITDNKISKLDLKCSHNYCQQCICNSFQESFKCKICNENLNKEEIAYIVISDIFSFYENYFKLIIDYLYSLFFIILMIYQLFLCVDSDINIVVRFMLFFECLSQIGYFKQLFEINNYYISTVKYYFSSYGLYINYFVNLFITSDNKTLFLINLRFILLFLYYALLIYQGLCKIVLYAKRWKKHDN